MVNELTPRTFVSLVEVGPRPPAADGGLHTLLNCPLSPRRWDRHRAGDVLQGEAHRLAGGELDRAAGGRALDLERRSARQHQHVGPTASHHRAFYGDEQRMDQPVLHAWLILDAQIHPSVDALGTSQQHARRATPQLMTELVRPRGHCVQQHERPRRGAKGRLQHHRALEIAPANVGLARRAQRPMAGHVVEQPGKDRGAIETPRAEPVDGAVAADQSRRAAVGDQRVVRDGPASHRSIPSKK